MFLVPKALTIAGSDSGGGAGIQADLKTFTVLGVFGMSAVTAVTVQNTEGVFGIYDIPVEGITGQVDVIFRDLGADAVKTGMLSQPEVIEAVAERIRYWKVEKLVVDPVMVAKGGAHLLAEEAKQSLRDVLLPLALCITPNIPEAEAILGTRIESRADMEAASRQLVHELGVRSVVLKGGHLQEEESADLFYDGQELRWYTSPRVQTRHTHGTGCTFSAAITAQLAKGQPLTEAIATAKRYISAAITHALGIGKGHGPTNHWAYEAYESVEKPGIGNSAS